MTALDRAGALLEALNPNAPGCSCPDPQTLHEPGCPWVGWITGVPHAEAALYRARLDLLAAAIQAWEALDKLAHLASCYTQSPQMQLSEKPCTCPRGPALAAFEELFKEESRG